AFKSPSLARDHTHRLLRGIGPCSKTGRLQRPASTVDSGDCSSTAGPGSLTYLLSQLRRGGMPGDMVGTVIGLIDGQQSAASGNGSLRIVQIHEPGRDSHHS